MISPDPNSSVLIPVPAMDVDQVTPQAGPSVRVRKVKTCDNCRRRKVKCDRAQPCSKCRAQGLPCVSSKSSNLPRGRQGGRKKTNIELNARIEKLEGLVKQVMDMANTPSPSKVKNDDVTPDDSQENLSKVQSDSKPQKWTANPAERHLAASVFTSLCDDINDLAEVLNQSSDDEEDDDDDNLSPENGRKFLNTSSAFSSFPFSAQEMATEKDNASIHFSDEQTLFLLKRFMDNVDVVVKILHPAVLQRLHQSDDEEIAGRNDSKGMLALKSSVFYVTVTSLTSEECFERLGHDKSDLLPQLQDEVELALARADLPVSAEMSALQALVLYLFALRSNDASRRAWTLTSLAVRFAQALDLHREARYDGFLPPYSPFDAELRRRLWWQIALLDRQGSFDRASDRMIDYGSYDVRLPHNINDADFGPDTKEDLQDRNEYTDATLSLVCHEIFDIERRLNYVFSGEKIELTGNVEDWWYQRRKLAFDCEAKLRTKYFSHCDHNVPIQRYVVLIGEIVIAIMWLIVYRPLQRHPSQPVSLALPPQGLLQLAMTVVETSAKVTDDEQVQNFRWLSSIWVQWHALTVMIAELHAQTEGLLVERAWKLLDDVFEPMGAQIADRKQGRLWKSIKKMMAKAQTIRRVHFEKAHASQQATRNPQMNQDFDMSTFAWQPNSTPGWTSAPTGVLPVLLQVDQQTLNNTTAGNVNPDMNMWQGNWSDMNVDQNWNFNQQAWAEWESFVDDYQNMGGFTHYGD